MVTAGGGGSEEVEFRAKFNIDVAALQAQLKQVFGNIPNMIGQASGQFGGGQGNVNESGQVKQNTKEQDERSRVRTASLKHLAQQFPGGGLMTNMAQAFKGGGLMAGVATGITAAVGILTNIMKSSQVFQTLSGTVFKVLGFMADMFLMPFVPMMMKFVNWMLQHMPQIQAAGEKTVAVLEGIASVLGWGARQQEAGKERGGFWGGAQRALGAATNVKTLAGAAMVAGGVGMTVASGGILSPVGAGLVMGGGGLVASGVSDSFQMGGRVPGSPGQGVPAMLHGGEMVIPQDIAAGAKGMGGRVAAWIERFQQKEMGPGGVINKWYDEMFGNSIIPKMWGDIRGLFTGIESETEAVGRSVESSTGDIESDQKSFWSKLKFWEHIADGWTKIKECVQLVYGKIKDFFTFNVNLPGLPTIDWGGLMGKLGEVGSKIGGWIAKATDFIIPDFPKPSFSWSTIWSCMQTIGSSIAGFFTGTIPNALNTAWKGIIGGLAAAGKWLISLPGKIITCLGTVASSVGNFFWSTIPSKIMAAVEKVVGWAPSFGDIGGAITGALDYLGNMVKAAANKIKDGISGIWSWTGLAFGRLTGSGRYQAPIRGFGGGYGGYGGTGAGTGAGDTGSGGDTGGGDTGGGDIGSGGAGTVVTTTTGNISTLGEVQGTAGMSEEEMDVAASMVGAHTPSGGLSLGPQAPAVYYESGAGTVERQLSTSLGTIGRSGTYYVAPTRMIASGLHARGRAFGRLGRGGGGGGGVALAQRTVNISITSNQSVADIVKDVERLQTMDEASFFNSVF